MIALVATTRRRWPLSRRAVEEALAPWEPEAEGSALVLHPMPGARVTVRRDGLDWRFSARTHIHGPGLHALFYELLEELAPKLKVTYAIWDPAKFSRDRSPERLEAFYADELVKIGQTLENREPSALLQEHWALEAYDLVEGAGVAGPISRWPRAEFLRRVKEEPERLAEDFYVAPHAEPDGWYHRNLALLTLQNEISYLCPDEQALAAQVCEELERAALLEPGLPLPLDEYRRCAALSDREAVELPNPPLPWGLIGYRREPLRHRFPEGFSLVHPGHLLPGPGEEGFARWSDTRMRLEYRVSPGAPREDWPALEDAPRFSGLPAPELAASEMALGLKCACPLGKSQLELRISFEAPYTWEDIWALLNSLKEEKP